MGKKKRKEHGFVGSLLFDEGLRRTDLKEKGKSEASFCAVCAQNSPSPGGGNLSSVTKSMIHRKKKI